MLHSKQRRSTWLIMAARAGKMERDSGGSSSSDEEELRRCRDAVWETPSDKKKGGGVFVIICSEETGQSHCTER